MVAEALALAGQYTETALNSVPQTTTCEKCIGACCMQGNGLELLPSEADYLTKQGTDLVLLPKKELPRDVRRTIQKGKDIYEFRTDCGNLDPQTRRCTDYENRPQACRDFKANTNEESPCHYKREQIGARVLGGVIDLPMPVVPKLDEMMGLTACSAKLPNR